MSIGKHFNRIVTILVGSLAPALCLGGAGDLDLAFSTDGKVATDLLGGASDRASRIALQENGGILVSGSSVDVLNTIKTVLACYDSGGTLDLSFGTDGAVTDADVGFGFVGIATQPGTGIILAGSALADPPPGPGSVFALTRVDLNGTPDATFAGGTGIATADFGQGTHAEGPLVAIQPDGKIVQAGTSGNGFAVARYSAEGIPDGMFGTAGLVTMDLGGSVIQAEDLAIQSDGKILVAGFISTLDTSPPSGPQVVFRVGLARCNSDGSPDDGGLSDITQNDRFGTAGTVIVDLGDFSKARPTGIALQSDGKIVVAARVDAFRRTFRVSALFRLNPDGALDDTFGTLGLVLGDVPRSRELFFDVAIQADDKVVAVGTGFDPTTSLGADFLVARYSPDGSSLDTSFGASASGVVLTDFAGATDIANALAIQRDGRIVAVGFAENTPPTGRDFALARYLTDLTTSPGVNVVVEPNDPTTGQAAVTITFEQVTQAGTTTVVTSDIPPEPLPGGFVLLTPPTSYDIETTAQFSGPIEVCINYTQTPFEAGLRLLHFENGLWEDRTTSLDTVNNIICGSVSSLSPFAVVEDIGPPVVIASLDPIGEGDDGLQDDDEGRFRIRFSATDNADPNPEVSAVLLIPGVSAISVDNGQIIEFEFDVEKTEVEIEIDVLEIEAPALILEATATDAAGNTAVAEAQPTGLAPDNDDESDSDD